jgi:hypothetical protein
VPRTPPGPTASRLPFGSGTSRRRRPDALRAFRVPLRDRLAELDGSGCVQAKGAAAGAASQASVPGRRVSSGRWKTSALSAPPAATTNSGSRRGQTRIPLAAEATRSARTARSISDMTTALGAIPSSDGRSGASGSGASGSGRSFASSSSRPLGQHQRQLRRAAASRHSQHSRVDRKTRGPASRAGPDEGSLLGLTSTSAVRAFRSAPSQGAGAPSELRE